MKHFLSFALITILLISCSKDEYDKNAKTAEKLSGQLTNRTATIYFKGEQIFSDFTFSVSANGDSFQGVWSNDANGSGTLTGKISGDGINSVILTYNGKANGVTDSTGCTGLYKGLGNLVNNQTGMTLSLFAESQKLGSSKEQCGDKGVKLDLILQRP